jgi:hypothetical protein
LDPATGQRFLAEFRRARTFAFAAGLAARPVHHAAEKLTKVMAGCPCSARYGGMQTSAIGGE